MELPSPKRRRFDETDLSVTTTTHPRPYDVFLSFRGDDTRDSFTGHLRNSLVQKGIRVFIDDDGLRKGEEISSALLKAIEESKISIIIFSENYASSRWCLDELVHILQCRESKNQLVWPVFYKVDPSVVRNQIGKYGEALAKHEGRFKEEKVQTWRAALRDASNLSGWTFMEGHEANFISKIVKDISAQVSKRTHLNVAKHPVGIESRVQEMLELLDVGSSDIRMVGIWGIGGIGKTTIAKAVYNSIAHKFEGYCFLGNVREESVPHQGLVGLQNILLSELLGEKKMKLTNVDIGINVIKERLGSKRVLLVLDDVSELNQLDKLAGDSNWFGHGSRIIITTRDKRLLVAHHVHSMYTAKELDNDEACKLLSLNALKENRNPDEFPISTAVIYTHGLPLAINILGSLLCGKSIDQWEAALDSYKRYPNRDVQKILETSYIALEYQLREAFLDVACFFKGWDKDYVMEALEGSVLINPRHAIEQLEEKALLSIDEDGFIQMHDLLEEMGKEIVKNESLNDPGSRSRLWFHEDVYQVLTKNTGTSKVKGIQVKLPTEYVEICLGAKCFKKMVNLQIFININARFSGEVRYLPNQLRIIDWRYCPLESFPSDFDPQKLVRLKIANSKISRLVQEPKIFKNLKDIKFDGCEFLTEFPVLPGMFPNVKSLSFADCSNLAEVPRIVHMKSLELLFFYRCKRLENFQKIGGRVESLRRMYFALTAIKQFPSSIGYELVNLQVLFVIQSENLTSLPRSIFALQHLEALTVMLCPKMTLEEKTPTLANSKEISLDNYYGTSLETKSIDDRGNLPLRCACAINLSGSAIVSLPVFFSECDQVTTLSLKDCTRLEEISGLPLNLKILDVSGCVSLKRILKLSNILKREESQMLRTLNFSGCQTLWDNLVDEADKQGWLGNGLGEADVISLFLLSQQSAFRVIFPPSAVPNKWLRCEIANHGRGVVEFDFEILPNFDWENTGFAICLVTGDSGLGFMMLREIWGDDFTFLQYKLKMYIKEMEVESIGCPDEFEVWENRVHGEACLYYIPFKGIDMSQFGQIRLMPPFQCRVVIHLADWCFDKIESYRVHFVVPPEKDVCMKLSHISSRNPDDTESVWRDLLWRPSKWERSPILQGLVIPRPIL